MPLLPLVPPIPVSQTIIDNPKSLLLDLTLSNSHDSSNFRGIADDCGFIVREEISLPSREETDRFLLRESSLTEAQQKVFRQSLAYRSMNMKPFRVSERNHAPARQLVALQMLYGDEMWIQVLLGDKPVEGYLAFNTEYLDEMNSGKPLTPFMMSMKLIGYEGGDTLAVLHKDCSDDLGALGFLLSRWHGGFEIELPSFYAQTTIRDVGNSWLALAVVHYRVNTKTGDKRFSEWVDDFANSGRSFDELAPYFCAGVSDINSISEAISNGVDADLLANLR
jgi:hypothetical protein